MFTSSRLQKSLQATVFTGLGIAVLGVGSASAFSINFPDSTSVTSASPCDLTKTSLCKFQFTKSLTINGDQVWNLSGTVSMANASLSTSQTGQQIGGTVFTLTAAKFTYTSGLSATSTLPGLFLKSDNVDLTTLNLNTLQYDPLPNPYLIHQTKGFFSTTNSGVNSLDRLTSSVDLLVSGINSSNQTVTNQAINTILSNDSTKSGTPSGTSYPFQVSSQANNIIAQLTNTTITTRLNSVTLGRGDTMNLPASECVVLGGTSLKHWDDDENGGDDGDNGHGDKGSKGNNGLGNGEDPQPPGNPPVNDGPGTSPGNPGNKHLGSGSQGNKDDKSNKGNTDHKDDQDGSHRGEEHTGQNNGMMTPEQAEELCTQVAKQSQDKASVPEPSGGIPVIGAVILGSVGWLLRKR
jgi:hypothetical protein